MRRGISILLALLVGFGPLWWPLSGNGDQRLPACCRRTGAHHCAMAAAASPDGATALHAPLTCPSFPRVLAAVVLPGYALAAAAAQLRSAASRARVPLPPDPASLSGPSYTHAGRGPPARS